jgi:sulfide:quinone oxidoreductase
MRSIVILGAGTAGTIMANRLARQNKADIASGDLTITVVDQDGRHIYQPGLLFVPFGIYRPDEIVKRRNAQLPESVRFVVSEIDVVNADDDEVLLIDGTVLPYDVLIVATGTRVSPEETEGLTGPGWGEKMFEFYTPDGAAALAGALDEWEGGRLVIDVVDMPIKCPVAPLEFAFLADWYFTKRGIRDKVDITYVTPLPGAFTKPTCSDTLGYLLKDKGITLVTEFNAGEVDGSTGRLISWDERVVPFDLLVSVPLHMGAEFVGRSPGLGDDLDFVLTDPATLQSTVQPNIFALGDASNVPTSKAGSVAHFQAEVLSQNVQAYLEHRPLGHSFDGHANCFIETGHGKALLIDFNYDVEPLSGRFPLPTIGPLPLLKESRLNHWGKLAFRWIYWNMLLPGRSLPFVTPNLDLRGKNLPAATTDKAA